MKRRMTALFLSLLLALGLCACGEDVPVENPNGPGRMVRRIEVAIHPEDDSFSRTYVTQENMNDLLALLRAMSTTDYPAQAPDIDGGQTYYTATVTCANGQQHVYYLLGHTYLRAGDDPWCLIDMDLSLQFTEFLHTRPSDDGSMPIETTVPAASSAPPETTAPTQ